MQKIKNLQLNGQDGKAFLLDIFFNNLTVKKPVVVYAHGFNGFKDWGNFDLIAQQFVEAGYVFIKFNFSHNGTTIQNPESFGDLEAFGKNNYTKELADLGIVIDWICDNKNPYSMMIDTNLIYLFGHSMGAGICILFASEDRRIKKLLAWASVAACKTPWANWPAERMAAWKETGVDYYLNGRTRQQMPLYYQLYEDFEQNHERLNIRKAISKLTIPILLCHGTMDTAVPVEKVYQLQQWQPNAKLVILETDHVFGRKHPWTEEQLPAATEEAISVSLDFLALKK